jgi:hypothetical protein
MIISAYNSPAWGRKQVTPSGVVHRKAKPFFCHLCISMGFRCQLMEARMKDDETRDTLIFEGSLTLHIERIDSLQRKFQTPYVRRPSGHQMRPQWLEQMAYGMPLRQRSTIQQTYASTTAEPFTWRTHPTTVCSVGS